MQLPIHGQWWSNLSTQLLQSWQCVERGGRIILHEEQYLYWIRYPSWLIQNDLNFLFSNMVGQTLLIIPGSLVVTSHKKLIDIIYKKDEIIGTDIDNVFDRYYISNKYFIQLIHKWKKEE